MPLNKDWLRPDWDVPGVLAVSTTRAGGVSQAPFDSLNLGDHVDDNPSSVAENRQILTQALGLNQSPAWLNQVHGVAVVEADASSGVVMDADASFSRQPGTACVVMTADCLPVLLSHRDGSVVAAAHAGWRGLVDGVLEQTVEAMGCPAEDILAWMGPAIGPAAFEVGDEVRERFLDHDRTSETGFQPHGEGKWLADIYRLARQRLASVGVGEVSGGGLCTYSDPKRFYSFRRDGQTGRMASVIFRQL